MTQPRLLSREEAAAYVGLSPAQFDQEVKAGTFPPRFPFAATRRALWDRGALDRAIDARMTVTVDVEGFDVRRERWHRARKDRQEDARGRQR